MPKHIKANVPQSTDGGRNDEKGKRAHPVRPSRPTPNPHTTCRRPEPCRSWIFAHLANVLHANVLVPRSFVEQTVSN